jgi:hypothetical protein
VKENVTILSRYGNIIERFSRKWTGILRLFTGAWRYRNSSQSDCAPCNSTAIRPSRLSFVEKTAALKVADERKEMAFSKKPRSRVYFPIAFQKHGVTNINTFFSEYYLPEATMPIYAVLDRLISALQSTASMTGSDLQTRELKMSS